MADQKRGLGTWIFLGLLGLLVFKAYSPASTSSNAKQPIAINAEDELRRQQADRVATAECVKTLADRKVTYNAKLDERKFGEARNALGTCAALLGDPDLLAMERGAMRLHHLQNAESKTLPASARLYAMGLLRTDFPADADRFEPTRIALQAQIDKQAAADTQKAAAAEKAAKRRAGVHLGMTRDDVLASSWGKPTKVNTSTYKFGVHEQWVYRDGGGYLYFEDGVLTAIQN